MVRLAPMIVLLLLASAASAETIWLRGRGKDVWIEKDGQVSDPQPNRKGFTRVATSAMPGVTSPRTRPAPRPAVRRHSDGVVFGPTYRYPYRRYYTYGHDYRYGRSYVYSPRVRYRSHYRPHYRTHYRTHYRSHDGHHYRNRHGYGYGRRYGSGRQFSRPRHSSGGGHRRGR